MEIGRGAMEENTMAILDSSSFLSSHHLLDDKLAFLEAVRAACLLPENGTPPTRKMFAAIFQILKEETSLDLIMSSYLLLMDLDKRFPRVYLSEQEMAESSSPPAVDLELVVVEGSWSPFNFGVEDCGSLDPSEFQYMMQELVKMAENSNSEALDTKTLANMLLLQYLVSVLEGDFFPRNRAFTEQMNWIFLRESLLSMLLRPKSISCKTLLAGSMSIMCKLFPKQSEPTTDMNNIGSSSSNMYKDRNAAVVLALPEIEKSTCIALKKLLLMIMELDSSRDVADRHDLTNRTDGVRILWEDIIIDELHYNSDILSTFFQVFDVPLWKLKIIVQWFQKRTHKSSTRSRRSNGSVDDASFNGVLKSLSNSNSARSITKNMKTEVVQFLLAHAFQAYLSLPPQHSAEGISGSKEDVRPSPLVTTCNDLISAFTCLRNINKDVEIVASAREALFTAATIIATKS